MEKNKKRAETKNLKIILTSLISAGVVIFGVVKTKNVLKLKKAAQKEAELVAQKAKEKAEKLAQETKDRADRLAREAKEKAKKEAEILAQNNAKKEADRLNRIKEEAKIKAEQEAKIKTEQEAKIKAEQEAKIAAQNLKTNGLKDLQVGLREKITLKPYDEYFDGAKKEELRSAVFSMSVHDFGNEIVNSIKKAEQSGLNQQDILKEVKSALNITDESIDSISKSFLTDNNHAKGLTSFNAKNQLKQRQALVSDIEKLQNKYSQKGDESLSDYFTRLLDMRKQNKEEQKLRHIETIKQKLQYGDNGITEEKIVLTPEEVNELRTSLKSSYYGDEKLYLEASEEQLKRRWLLELTNDMDTSVVPKRIEQACFQTLKRYDSSLKDYLIDSTFVHEPLYRWMAVNNVDAFVEKNFTPGVNYKFPRFQSCSKDKSFAETYYNDWNPGMNFKFIIHPKSKISKAHNVENGCYGSNEAVYSADENFVIIDKRIEEFVVNNPKSNCGIRSFFKWIVEMQEV